MVFFSFVFFWNVPFHPFNLSPVLPVTFYLFPFIVISDVFELISFTLFCAGCLSCQSHCPAEKHSPEILKLLPLIRSCILQCAQSSPGHSLYLCDPSTKFHECGIQTVPVFFTTARRTRYGTWYRGAQWTFTEWIDEFSVQSLSPVWLFVTPWTAACQASQSITNFRSWLKLASVELVMPSYHLGLCCPLLLLPLMFPSIRVFFSESVLRIRWRKYWSFSFSISPSSEYSGLISFRMDWLDLLAVQGTLKSLLQHHSSKASILQCSAFFTVQLSYPYMTTGKTTALTRRTIALSAK